MSCRTSSRRAFLGAAASAALSARAANDRLSIGMIGCRGRGPDLLEDFEQSKDLNVAVTAVCDVYRPNLEPMAAVRTALWHGGDLWVAKITTANLGYPALLS